MSERIKGAVLFRYTDEKRVQPVGVELVIKRTGEDATMFEVQVIIGGDWHETIAVDAGDLMLAMGKK